MTVFPFFLPYLISEVLNSRLRGWLDLLKSGNAWKTWKKSSGAKRQHCQVDFFPHFPVLQHKSPQEEIEHFRHLLFFQSMLQSTGRKTTFMDSSFWMEWTPMRSSAAQSFPQTFQSQRRWWSRSWEREALWRRKWRYEKRVTLHGWELVLWKMISVFKSVYITIKSPWILLPLLITILWYLLMS